MQNAVLRLFNAVQIESPSTDEISQNILERTVRSGYLLDPAIQPDEDLLDVIESVVGLSGEKANAAFHKSWTVIQDSPIEQLVMQQMIHYLTTYGFEMWDIYREDTVYIPHETLELPALQEDLPLTVIRGQTAEDILERLIKLGSGIALARETLNDFMAIVEANTYDSGFMEAIRNHELKARLYDFYDLAPSEPVEFLRYMIIKSTGESLIIKNQALIDLIKKADGKIIDDLLHKAPEDLASIFFRFKPLFLAMKSVARNKAFFNTLRRNADAMHRPMPADYMNSVTMQLKRDQLDPVVLAQRLENASIFRKIRLAYALNFRLHAEDATVYRIRSGRGWATEFSWSADEQATQHALDIVLTSIKDAVRENVKGRTIYIPPHIHYALPATEKQFTGHLPSGSYVTVPEDMIAGVHWTNTPSHRVDLDLSIIDRNGKTGWDAAYRSEDGGILFSGDMTDAPLPNGATELFYLRRGGVRPKIVMLNYFNYHPNGVAARLLVAREKPENFGKNYMVDPGNIIASARLDVTARQQVVGLVAETDGEFRFCFAGIGLGKSISSKNGALAAYARKYLMSQYMHPLCFRDILDKAGADVVADRPDGDHLDLSPESLDKTTILDLINPVGETPVDHS